MKNKNIILLSISLSSIFLVNLTSYADLSTNLLKCSNIQNNAQRLECFDSVAKLIKLEANSTQINPIETNSESKSASSLVTKAPVITPQKTNSVMPEFDKTTVKKEFLIEANLIGEFKGWDKYSIFKLNNGQIWRAVRGNARTKKLGRTLINPKITITRGAITSYNLRVEGVSGKLKVKRLK